jgi:uncharacterized protein DUF5666
MLFGLVVLTTACGNHSPASPTSPSTTPSAAAAPAPAPVSASGATVVGVSGASRIRTLATSLTVSVSGSSISSPVDNAGHFTLQNVPAGHVELRFTGAGVDARLGLDNVAEHQVINITVRVSGTTAELDNNEREDENHNAEVEGIVTATGANTLTVAGKTITVSATTTIGHGSTPMTLASIHVGDRVEVHGMATSATTIAATKIEVETEAAEPGEDQEAEVDGTVTAVGANSLTVGTRMVSVVATTRIVSDGTSVALSSIHVGDRVEAKGTMSGTTLVATRIEVKSSGSGSGDDHGGNNPGAQVELSGTVSGRSTGCPVTFTVASTMVVTDTHTEFKDTSCTTLANGNTVEVKGTKQTNGSVLATRVEKKK